jgi:hypothetical protein
MNASRLSQVVRRAGRFLLPALAVVALARGGDWEIGPVDGSIGSSFSSLRFDRYGNAHVAYVAEEPGILQYSFWDHRLNKWFTTTVDRAAGFCSLALDSRQHPHISYNYAGKLKHAFWDGSVWQRQSIPLPSKEVTYFTSIALDANDNPSITFYEIIDASNEQVIRLRIVTWNQGVWELKTIDPDRGSGKFNSLAIDSLGRPHVAYCNVRHENSSLRYAHWDGKSWNNEILEGAGLPGTYRQAALLLLDKHDTPHIAYSDALNQIVKYAAKVNGKWQIEVVEPIGRIAFPDRNGIDLDERGNPYISYYDGQTGILKVAYRNGGRWISEIVDRDFAGYTSSLQINAGIIWITYSGGPGGGLRFARRHLPVTALENEPGNGARSK